MNNIYPTYRLEREAKAAMKAAGQKETHIALPRWETAKKRVWCIVPRVTYMQPDFAVTFDPLSWPNASR